MPVIRLSLSVQFETNTITDHADLFNGLEMVKYWLINPSLVESVAEVIRCIYLSLNTF